MQALEAEYGNDPSMEALLKMIESWGSSEKHDEDKWKGESGWHHFWHGEPLSNPHYFENFAKSINGQLQDIAEQAVGNPELFCKRSY